MLLSETLFSSSSTSCCNNNSSFGFLSFRIRSDDGDRSVSFTTLAVDPPVVSVGGAAFAGSFLFGFKAAIRFASCCPVAGT